METLATRKGNVDNQNRITEVEVSNIIKVSGGTKEGTTEVDPTEAEVEDEDQVNREANLHASNKTTIHQTWTTQVCSPEVNQVKGCNENEERDNCNEINWLLDSGCMDHIVNNENYFCNHIELRNPIDVKLPDGKILKATKLGTVKTIFKNYYNKVQVELKKVYFVEGIKKNLLSFSKITENNTIVAREQNAKIYNKYRKLTAVAIKINELYTMKSFLYNNKKNDIYANAVKMTNKEKWHRALGHVNFKYLNKIINDKLVEGLPDKIESMEMKCANCLESKIANVPFENKRTKTTEILEIIHTDLNGPHSTTGYGGEKYFLTFIDDYSKCTRIFCIKNKSETAGCLKEFVNLVENKFNKKVKKLQCDNGKEYFIREIFEFIKSKGIELLPCPPYVHELNGVAERYTRSAMDIGRCLMREAKIHRRYWPEIMKTVAYLKNRTIANTAENRTPYEIFFGKKPNVEHLKIYGSRVFVRVPESLRKSKWDDKSQLGVLVGYVENGYRVLINNRIINVRHVQVVEENTKLICLEKIDDQKDRDLENSKSINIQNETDETESEINKNNVKENKTNPLSAISTFESDRDNTTNTNNIGNDKINVGNENNGGFENENLSVPRKSNRKKSLVNRYGNPVTHFIYVNYIDANVPNTFEEAINSSEYKQWQTAMDSEIKSLKKNNTWQTVERPKDKKVIDVKWVYKKKNNSIYEARLVVKGFQQKEYVENVYSPVVKCKR